MTLTSSFIILALSFFTIASALVLPRDQLTHCVEAFELDDPSTDLPIPAIVNLNDNGGWTISSVVGAPVASVPGGGDKIRVAVAVSEPVILVKFVFEGDHTRGIAVEDGFLVTAKVDGAASNQKFKMVCDKCTAVDQPAPVGSAIAEVCQFTPEENPDNVCVTAAGNEVTVVPCSGSRSNDQLFNLVVI